MIKRALHVTYRMARRIVIFTVGTTVLLTGVALIVLPGPAFVVIPVGLAILSLEFAWARHWLKRVRETITKNTSKLSARRADQRRAAAESSRDDLS
jgi:tellurite resistance protein TerC